MNFLIEEIYELNNFNGICVRARQFSYMKNGNREIMPKLNVEIEEILLSVQVLGMLLSVSLQNFFQLVELLVVDVNLFKLKIFENNCLQI